MGSSKNSGLGVFKLPVITSGLVQIVSFKFLKLSKDSSVFTTHSCNGQERVFGQEGDFDITSGKQRSRCSTLYSNHLGK